MRNKKRTSIIVAAFMAVFLAGSAFAFTNLDPLVWNGTAAVNADIRLEIIDFDVLLDDTTSVIVSPALDGSIPGVKLVTFDIPGFTTPGQEVDIDFIVKNVGTMHAEIETVVEVLFEDGVANPPLITTISGFGLNDIIAPDAEETVNIHVEFDPAFDPGSGIWSFSGNYTFQLRMYYTFYLP